MGKSISAQLCRASGAVVLALAAFFFAFASNTCEYAFATNAQPAPNAGQQVANLYTGENAASGAGESTQPAAKPDKAPDNAGAQADDPLPQPPQADVYAYKKSESSPHVTYTKNGEPCSRSGWALLDGSWYWFDDSPYAAESCWKLINGAWYYFDNAAVMQTGTFATPGGALWHANSSGALVMGNNSWAWSEGNWYWTASSGQLSTGWLWDSGWYWLDKATGAMSTGWIKDVNTWYLMNSSGKMLTGWQWVGAWFWFNSSGALHTGWLWDKAWYWIDENAGMSTGWVDDEDTWYHCAPSGIMQSNAWVLDENNLWHWANASGAMKSGWTLYNGIWYYLDPEDPRHATATGIHTIGSSSYSFAADGAMSANAWVVCNTETGEAKYAGESGALAGNAIMANGNVTLLEEDGTPSSGWVTLAGKCFYAMPDSGIMAKGWLNLEGTWYYLSNQGVMATGWVNVGGTWYLLGDNGAMKTGWQYVDGTWYYLDAASGAMHTGWLNDNGTWYYLYGSGAMATGWIYVDDAYYYLNGSGAWDPNADPMYWRAQGYSSRTSWLILCDTTRNELCIYWGSQGNWKLQKYWTCTTGAWNTPTVLGEFTVGAKGYVFGSGFSCYYYTQFCGNYLFHSVTYYQNTFNIMDGRLGMNLSHGCVRLQIDNAKWIYDNIPYGTKVVTF